MPKVAGTGTGVGGNSGGRPKVRQPQPSASGIDAAVARLQAGPDSTGGSSGGSSGGSTTPPDYSQLFAAFGMTQQMITQINNLMAQLISSGMDDTTAYDTIVGEIRGGQIGANYNSGMSWYQYTYGGIQYGMATGLLDSSNPEASYRQYVNTVNQYYQEYLGRDATRDEVINWLQGGTDASRVQAQLKGQSYANAYASSDSNAQGYSWNALLGAFGQLPNGEKQLSDQEKLALGESMTGYSTTLGDQLQKQLQTATARLQTIFRGTLATPADLQKTGAGLRAPSLSAGPTGTTDTGPI
jgi:hypothetical protein